MGGPAWTLEFVRLPDATRAEPATTLEQQVHRFVAMVTTSQAAGGQGDTWRWDLVGPLSRSERKRVREEAERRGLLPYSDVPVTNRFADWGHYVVAEVTLPANLYGATDDTQFDYCNAQIGGERDGYTWHHHQDSGRMQLVLTAAHDSVKHDGGRRQDGGWATGGR